MPTDRTRIIKLVLRFGIIVGVAYIIKKFTGIFPDLGAQERELEVQDRKLDQEFKARERFKDETKQKVERSTALIMRERLAPYISAINSNARATNGNRFVVAAVIWQESRANPSAEGAASEIGLMQITPGALQEINRAYFTKYKPVDLFDPGINIFVGSRYLNFTYIAMGKDTLAGLRAYNCGPTGAKNNKLCGRAYANEVLDFARFMQVNDVI